jgi:hypothetical protein
MTELAYKLLLACGPETLLVIALGLIVLTLYWLAEKLS